VRKAPLPGRREAHPFAPTAVEALRRAVRVRHPSERHWGGTDLGHRDAGFISLLAYAGLRPHEAIDLAWAAAREHTLLVRAPKTQSTRTVRLLDPLRRDLAEWRLARGRPADDTPIIVGHDGHRWSTGAYAQWRTRTWTRALKRARLPTATPYVLRHSFASLLLHEGRSVIYVARQLGHGAELTMRTYGHVIDELEDEPLLTAEEAIRVPGNKLVPVWYLTAKRMAASWAANPPPVSAGSLPARPARFERATSCSGGKRSIP
jgi:integrase